MPNTVIELSDEKAMQVESILLDDDQADALRFIKQVIKPQLRAKRAVSLDSAKSTGIMTQCALLAYKKTCRD